MQKEYLDKFLQALSSSKLTQAEKLEICENIFLLLESWFSEKDGRRVQDARFKNDYKSVYYAVHSVIPTIEHLLEKASKDDIPELFDIYERLYAFAGRRSLEHFIDYMEWDKKNKVLSTRRRALTPFIYYLNKVAFDPTLKMVVASYPPAFGKCIDAETPILTPKGYVPIKDIKVGDEVCSMQDKEIVVEKVLNKWESKKTQIKITTRSGKKITISPDHHMLTTQGYKKATDLTLSDYFYSKLSTDTKFKTTKIDENELVYITCMIFEGHCKYGRLSYTAENNLITEKFLDACKNLGIDYYEQHKKDNKAISYRLTASNNNKAYKLLKKYNIADELCYTKRLPQCFFTLPIEQKWQFLGIMIATDGYIGNDTGITLANEGLIDDIHKILNSLGIYCKKSYKKTGNFESWRLFIPKEYGDILCQNCFLYQKENKKQIITNRNHNISSLSVTYPSEYFENLEPTGIRGGYKEELHIERKTNKTKRMFEMYVKEYSELEKHRYKDFFWEQIIKIEKIEQEIPMIDIEVSNTHNFIANGFVSHNSFCMNYYSAWRLGMHPDGSILRLSYSEELVNGFSRNIKQLISSPRFSQVFTQFAKFGGKPFEKDKESDWKIALSEATTSHIARTRKGSTTGVRATLDIILDDMVKGQEEATSSKIHEDIYTQWNTEWTNRSDSNDVNFIIGGTMWSPDDILNKVFDDKEKTTKIVKSKKFDWVLEAKDGSAVFIRVPALDKHDRSTCPPVKSTEQYRLLRESLDPYFFSCVYQQDPIAPSGLEFAYDNLRQFKTFPENISNFKYAVLDPARRGKDYVSMPIFARYNDDYYMIDCIFAQKAMTELYNSIVAKIINHGITTFVIENNTDTSLAELIRERLKAKGYTNCEIIEHYATKNKEKRIKDARGIAINSIVFRSKDTVKPNTDYGAFMKNLTSYSFDYPNKHDDAPDSIALFVEEIILGNSKLNKAKAFSRFGL